MVIKFVLYEVENVGFLREGNYASEYKPSQEYNNVLKEIDSFDFEEEAVAHLDNLDTGEYTILKVYVK